VKVDFVNENSARLKRSHVPFSSVGHCLITEEQGLKRQKVGCDWNTYSYGNAVKRRVE
jgi:hypothetical protein